MSSFFEIIIGGISVIIGFLTFAVALEIVLLSSVGIYFWAMLAGIIVMLTGIRLVKKKDCPKLEAKNK